jgi:hypothetical protein
MCPVSITAPEIARSAAAELLTGISKAVGEVPLAYANIGALKPAAQRAILEADAALAASILVQTPGAPSAIRSSRPPKPPAANVFDRINAEPPASGARAARPQTSTSGGSFDSRDRDSEGRLNTRQRSQR